MEGRTPEDAVDGRGGPDRDDFGVLRESPTLGDGKYKLEIGMRQTRYFPSIELRGPLSARTPIDAEASNTHTLSLYVTCLMLDDPNAEYEISASMLAAIKCQDDRVGERGARADWAWDTWQTEWTFRQDNEVWRESIQWRTFPLRILISIVYRVCIAVLIVTTREPEDPPDGLVCDLYTDPHPNGALLSSAPICVLRGPRSARGTRSFVG